MKQYPVIKDFIDKYTKDFHPKGSMYFTNDAERAEELQSNGFLGEEVKTQRKNMKKVDKSGADE